MRRLFPHTILLLAVLICIASCGDRGKVLSKKKLSAIYVEMFLSDQWLRDHVDERGIADTSLFYDPIFRKYGCTYEDYDASVHYYLDHPEQYSKVIDEVLRRLEDQKDKAYAIADRVNQAREFNSKTFGFIRRDYSTDSLRWENDITMWPYVEPLPDTTSVADSLAARDSLAASDSLAFRDSLALADSLAVQDKVIRPERPRHAGEPRPDRAAYQMVPSNNQEINAKRRDRIRANSQQKTRQLPGDQPAAVKREDL